MERKSMWMILAVITVIGVALNLMKASSPEQARFQRLARLGAMLDEGKAVYQPLGSGSRFKHKTINAGSNNEVAGLDSGNSATNTAPENATGEENKVVTKSDVEADAKKAAAEKKKKDAKKKKKKKKTIKGTGEQKDETAAADDDDKKADHGGSHISDHAVGGGIGSRGQQGAPDKEPETIDEWTAFLFPTPDFDRTSKLIKSYQNGLVKAEVYYPVIKLMLADERMETREFGVMALGSTPSVRSFSVLANYIAISLDGDRPKAQAKNYLKMYTRLEYLRLLAGALSFDDVNTNLQALEIVDVASSLHLKPAAEEATAQEIGDTPRAPATSLNRYFDSILTALKRSASESKFENVSAHAQQSYDQMQVLLGSQT